MTLPTRYLRSAALAAALPLLAGAASGQADTPAPTASECPYGPVSVYFAARDTATSTQSQAVLAKVRQTAAECAADRIDVIAHVDAGEGDHALGLALERLSRVADQLVSLGVQAGQIRVATISPDTDGRTDVGRREIDIMFGKREAPAPREETGAIRQRRPLPAPGEI